MEEYTVYSKFDINKHKETFIDYLEVVITPDGEIHYAVPSHQEFIIKRICSLRGITREQLNDRCPVEFYFNFLMWLTQESECICVWSTYLVGQIVTYHQRLSLELLIKEGLLLVKEDHKQ